MKNIEFETDATFEGIKKATEDIGLESESELIDEADWVAHDKLTTEEVIKIALEEDLFRKSATSYDSAENRPLIDVLASKIADKLKRDSGLKKHKLSVV